MKPFFSIIVPFKTVDKYLLDCVKWCYKQEYKKFEIILLPDNKLIKSLLNKKWKNIKIIPTGKVFPSKKRNIGMKHSKGDICAFIDADAFPKTDWLKNSIQYFKNEKIVAVGGPNISPKNEPLLIQISGMVITNFFATGSLAKRFKVSKKNYFADELSASNLIVRKSIMEKLDGFDETYFTAEDTKLCHQINKMGKKVLYAKDVQVYHHQRKWPFSYSKQIWKWGLSRGNSILNKEINPKLEHFLPFSFLLFIFFGGIISLFIEYFFMFYISVIMLYLLIAFFFSFNNGIIYSPFIFISSPITHITYAMGFLFGMMGFKK